MDIETKATNTNWPLANVYKTFDTKIIKDENKVEKFMQCWWIELLL